MNEQIVRLRITLDDTEPAVWRRVALPLTSSLKTLHLEIQAAMLFENLMRSLRRPNGLISLITSVRWLRW